MHLHLGAEGDYNNDVDDKPRSDSEPDESESETLRIMLDPFYKEGASNDRNTFVLPYIGVPFKGAWPEDAVLLINRRVRGCSSMLLGAGDLCYKHEQVHN